jgi:uncharacterized OB-fold protein
MSSPDVVAVPERVVTAENQGFWNGVDAGELRLARCATCGSYSLQEQTCVTCGGSYREWVAVSGDGILKSFVVFHRGYNAYWETQVPYNVAVIALREGPELLTNVVGTAIEDLRVGAAVTIEFQARGDQRAPVAVALA